MPSPQERATLAPPLIYLLFLTIACTLTASVPIPLPDDAWTRGLGYLLIAGGQAFSFWAIRSMKRHSTTSGTNGKPLELLQRGAFRFSRNPINLGDTLAYCGLACLLGDLWPWLLLPVLLYWMNRDVIRRDEAFLERCFGDTYRRYCLRVRRWI
ncbi:isoprenylcysteine carboxylmethyltransferase family protein [Pseudomonas sp. RIT-PI-AD]|uniref:methyltransferase family protein n=1 Tax=Pseudomonas sp. RIT-PI-AD TaxID=3035294 RepID=UPI0021DA859D|nr:isoprenylcysteine carboxylmethyltransferase family protein [Pseudomonas sp. RIT-PI-AD]